MPEYFSIESEQMQALSRRVEDLTRWLAEHAPNCETAQKHLDQGSAEQVYWQYGYVCALRDVVSMISRRSAE
jgi:inhibitor of KinA sporulation pathway (predicted exonuclease)